MNHGEPNDRRIKTLPGIGEIVSNRNHAAYHRSALRHWQAQEQRLDWFLSQLVNHQAATDLAHWYGELWARPARPGQVELALAALAELGTPQSRVALVGFETDEPILGLFKQVCLAHWDTRRR